MAENEPTATAQVAPGVPSGDGAVALRSGSPPAAAARNGEILPPVAGLPAPQRKKKRVVLPLLLMAGLGGGAYEAYGYFVEGRFLVSTDDAYVKADMSTIAAKVAGYVSLVPVVDNAIVAERAGAGADRRRRLRQCGGCRQGAHRHPGRHGGAHRPSGRRRRRGRRPGPRHAVLRQGRRDAPGGRVRARRQPDAVELRHPAASRRGAGRP